MTLLSARFHPITKLIVLSTAYCPLQLDAQPVSTILENKTSTSQTPSKVQDKAQAIYEIIHEYQIDYDIDNPTLSPINHPIDAPTIVGCDALIQKISSFVEKGESLRIHMVGFPFKSTNHDKKVLVQTPDMAERRALEFIAEFIQKIKTAYAPGVHFVLISDGRAFNDLLGISDETVSTYEKQLTQLAGDLEGIEIVTSKNLDILFSQSMTEVCKAFDNDTFAQQAFEKNLENNPKIQDELEVTKARLDLELDHDTGKIILKNIKGNDPLLLLAKRMMLRSQQFGQLLRQHFQKIPYIAFSVHFQKDIGRKFGMKLSPSSSVTPWHGVLCQDGDAYQIAHKSDVDLGRYQKTGKDINGVWCPYFQRKSI